MDRFLGKIYTGIKAVATFVTTGVCAASWSAPSAASLVVVGVPVIPAILTAVAAFTWVDLLFHAKTAQIAAEVHAEVVALKTERDALHTSVADLTAGTKDLKAERDKLARTVAGLNNTVADLGAVSADLKSDRDGLEAQVDTLTSTTESLQQQLAAQTELSREAKKFIATLVATESGLEGIRDDLVKSIEKSNSVASALSRITEQLSGERFSAIDVNGDGTITADEFTSWVNHLKK
jgi:uncharacterized phage infection (PIP) family protein YhgE